MPEPPSPQSSSLVLKAVEVGIKDIPYLLLWSAATEKLEFICIEPWYSLPDFESAESEWKQSKIFCVWKRVKPLRRAYR